MADMSSFRGFFGGGLLVRLWCHLGVRRRRQFFLLLGLMFISACAEVVSLGAVLPFLGVLTAPERVHAYPGVADAARSLGFTSADQLLLPITLAVDWLSGHSAAKLCLPFLNPMRIGPLCCRRLKKDSSRITAFWQGTLKRC